MSRHTKETIKNIMLKHVQKSMFLVKSKGGKMLEDPRLSANNVRVPRRDNYEKRPVLSATIHPDIKRTLVTMSERTGLSISQVTDEVLYNGLVEMQELEELDD